MINSTFRVLSAGGFRKFWRFSRPTRPLFNAECARATQDEQQQQQEQSPQHGVHSDKPLPIVLNSRTWQKATLVFRASEPPPQPRCACESTEHVRFICLRPPRLVLHVRPRLTRCCAAAAAAWQVASERRRPKRLQVLRAVRSCPEAFLSHLRLICTS